jgi:hypothetical protein
MISTFSKFSVAASERPLELLPLGRDAGLRLAEDRADAIELGQHVPVRRVHRVSRLELLLGVLETALPHVGAPLREVRGGDFPALLVDRILAAPHLVHRRFLRPHRSRGDRRSAGGGSHSEENRRRRDTGCGIEDDEGEQTRGTSASLHRWALLFLTQTSAGGQAAEACGCTRSAAGFRGNGLCSVPSFPDGRGL